MKSGGSGRRKERERERKKTTNEHTHSHIHTNGERTNLILETIRHAPRSTLILDTHHERVIYSILFYFFLLLFLIPSFACAISIPILPFLFRRFRRPSVSYVRFLFIVTSGTGEKRQRSLSSIPRWCWGLLGPPSVIPNKKIPSL